jgi:uncharacterized protein (TIGR02145 family)
MKITGTTYWFTPNDGATNSSGFTGMPGGLRAFDGSYTSQGLYGNCWSVTPTSSYSLNSFSLFYFGAALTPQSGDKNSGISCRCIKD